ncbi:hypothetical protein ERO13_D05G296000v2 [Gossypium hirsutum]|nr:hypothetical protein ERO13_D05G296000v2 [Gossypium hirsutum]
MASDECQGKSSWPELVGTNGETAAATIERENLNVNAQIISDQAIVVPVVVALGFGLGLILMG